jgi:hypothetical protein
VDQAAAAGCAAVCAAYNEPMIAAEWAHAVFAGLCRWEKTIATAAIPDPVSHLCA